MAQPVLVKAYKSQKNTSVRFSDADTIVHSIPPISSFAFDSILRAADSPELQSAIDGIADICAKSRMSLADEYGSHLPPLGEITAATSTRMRPHLNRPGMRTALTSVPEASSGSSEGSRKSSLKGGIFSFRRKQSISSKPLRHIRIGIMGRTVPVGSTTSLGSDLMQDGQTSSGVLLARAAPITLSSQQHEHNDAQASLRRLLMGRTGRNRPG